MCINFYATGYEYEMLDAKKQQWERVLVGYNKATRCLQIGSHVCITPLDKRCTLSTKEVIAFKALCTH